MAFTYLWQDARNIKNKNDSINKKVIKTLEILTRPTQLSIDHNKVKITTISNAYIEIFAYLH